jgi:hypothetical protein
MEFFKAMNWEWEDVIAAGIGSVSILGTALYEKLRQNRAWLKLYDKYKIYAK